MQEARGKQETMQKLRMHNLEECARGKGQRRNAAANKDEEAMPRKDECASNIRHIATQLTMSLPYWNKLRRE